MGFYHLDSNTILINSRNQGKQDECHRALPPQLIVYHLVRVCCTFIAFSLARILRGTVVWEVKA